MDARTPHPQAVPGALYIGDIARRTGRSVHTIRWYEAQGLMPGVIRDRGRRRVYSDYHIGRLELMERLRLTGMSIRQLREYTALVKQGSTTLRKRRALLAEHQRRVKAMIAKWTEALALVDAKIEFYDEWVAGGTRPTVSPQQRARAKRAAAKG
ncbi:MerR family transcriptional regulator [Bradyrhizobium sp. CCBAU 51753]|uniref:MerR family transcriptional regulator n=1 Tax=Bradyrhizobium sp. CCBAU 51753 TaxID=1325100 RepID=UPI00188BE8E8|nr:MerR family transcriptional regulator [Bradyrhizobium sp. CCBAU 51753]QOZ22887.1 MerR family transcriptional regulator [Bradyrhizobium sp. CCBAU 51753]